MYSLDLWFITSIICCTKHDNLHRGGCMLYIHCSMRSRCTILASKVLFHQTLVVFWLLELSWLGWTESLLLYVSLYEEEC